MKHVSDQPSTSASLPAIREQIVRLWDDADRASVIRAAAAGD